VFVWGDDRPDDRDVILADEVAHQVVHHGMPFELDSWSMRYSDGTGVTNAVYREAA
jgi:hypothetical protein